MRDLPKVMRRRKGIIGLTHVDMSINADTSQPTIIGAPCKNCGLTVKFAKRAGTCVRCHKQWRRDNERRPKYYYSKETKNVVKISPEQRQEMLESQGWACLICKKVEPRLYLDHCHDTGKIRGLLCLKCNSGLGCFSDDIERMQSAIEYLRSC